MAIEEKPKKVSAGEEKTNTRSDETENEPAESEDIGRGLRYAKTNASCRRCRRLGVKLFLKGERCFSPKCAFVRKKYAPGEHGQVPKRFSDYARQLQAKQIAGAIYGLNNQELRRIYNRASKTPSSTKEIFAQRLERRLDNVLYQAGLALSRQHAKQLITHRMVTVNNKKVLSPSYQIEKGDIIALSDRVSKSQIADELKRIRTTKEVPEWLERNNFKQVTVKSIPEKLADKLAFDIQLIIEYFSR